VTFWGAAHGNLGVGGVWDAGVGVVLAPIGVPWFGTNTLVLVCVLGAVVLGLCVGFLIFHVLVLVTVLHLHVLSSLVKLVRQILHVTQFMPVEF